ncbi:hypothetical protein [Methanosarcina sp.]|uniref:hypothetical protein n=1 Tax=Methanosarcina sp. TaxID=2213 RepID=UPI002BA2FB4C|nr:hypothetical protein [Methanosarcina sp.]HOW13505.1 hypothetical protein [Methanosarcina sp.]
MWERRKLTATPQGIRISLKGNASIADQKAWSLMPRSMKLHLKKQLKNTDRDSSPNGYDCHVRDMHRQEAFLAADQKIVGKLTSVKPGKLISHGGAGNVNTVEGLPGFVVKTPVNKKNSYYNEERKDGFEYERRFYKKHDLLDEPLFIPSKDVTVNGKPAILRPAITVISEPNRIISRKITSKITDKQLEIMRQKLIKLSMKGYLFYDGLQIGFDKSGRLLEYDCGEMEKTSSKDAFTVNNQEWLYFLTRIGKAKTEQEAARKYGTISRRS